MKQVFGKAGELPNNATDFGNLPDRPVLVTATCWLIRSANVDSSARPILRLQHRNWSDPKMHRANSEVQSECEWKQGRRAMISSNCSYLDKTINAVRIHDKNSGSGSQTGPPFHAVNGRTKKVTVSVDKEAPSHGTNTGTIGLPMTTSHRELNY